MTVSRTFHDQFTNWKRRQLIHFQIELAQVFGTRENPIRYSIALVVFHVERLNMDELCGTACGKGGELVARQGDVAQVLQGI